MPFALTVVLWWMGPAAFASSFNEIGPGLTGVYFSSVAWGDYDNDGDLDILLTGRTEGYSRVSMVYRNDGGGVFTDIAAGLVTVEWGSVAWGDCDSDGDLDILLTGMHFDSPYTYTMVAKVYRNDGGNVFTDIGAGLTGVRQSSVAWGDYDNDGDLDILLTGYSGASDVAKVYRNDGGGSFTDIGAGLTGVRDSSVAWGDYDNDGDLDILLTGWNSVNIARVYRNDGGGEFTDIGAGLAGVYGFSGSAWGDYDQDGDLDILLTGTGIARVYRNDGGGVFTDIQAGLTGVYQSSAAWGDYDNDGDLDALVTGGGSTSGAPTRIYQNEGGGVFTEFDAGLTGGLTGVTHGSVVWGDYDGDGDLDILLTGASNSTPTLSAVSEVYRNDAATANTVPGTPSGLGASVSGNLVALSWTPASDTETPAAGLTYNLRMGTSPGANDVVSAMAAGSGSRRIPTFGNAQHGTTALLMPSLPPGTYYWSVQAVDTAFAGSPFALEGSLAYCGYSIHPTNVTHAAAGGSGPVSVTAGVECPWTATSNDPSWLTVTSGASGSGNGTVEYSVAANPGAQRTGTITIAGQTLRVHQGAAAPTLTVSRAGSGSGRITATNIDCGSGCTESYPQGTNVQLTATPHAGSAFVGWGGDCTGTQTTSTFTMDGEKSCVATFELAPGTAFFTLGPCRLIDTRTAAGVFGGPALSAGAVRVFPLTGQCGIRSTARAVSVNLTVTQPTTQGNLRLYPGGLPVPTISSVNYLAGSTRANNAVVALNESAELAVYCSQASGTAHFVLDVNGYFREPSPVTTQETYTCLGSASQVEVVTGHHEEKFVTSPARGKAFDARSADFLNRDVDHGMVSLRGDASQPGMCWAGGYVTTDKPWNASWSDHKDEAGPTRNSCALDNRATEAIVTGLHFFNVADGVRVNGGTNWVVQHSWAEYVRDDCIEDDGMAGGDVFDTLFDGCNVGISVDSTSGANGSGNVVSFDRVLLRIQAMPYPYNWESRSDVIDEHGQPYSGVGTPYGHGRIFKLGDPGTIPRFSITNSVFLATHRTNPYKLDYKLDFPPESHIVACENNTVIWLGSGDYPGALPNTRFPGCVKVVTGEAGRYLWRQLVTDWHARHPGVGANRKPSDPGNLDFPKVF